MKAPWLLLPIVMVSVTASMAATVPDRKAAVLGDRLTMEKDTRWIYNDWQRGFEEAKWKGKPLLVVLRCVPCLACQGIDASVLTDPALTPLLDQFVCVRLINANTIDLSIFQFDYDLSFSTMFFNGDGTVYGRFGSWKHQKNALDKDTAGFKRALEAALALHRGYPANKATLAGKQSAPIPFKDPLEIPELAGKYRRQLDWEGKVVQSCVHCHQVGDAIRSYYRDAKKRIPDEWIYPMPAPETIGLTLAPDQAARVQSVSHDSIAEKAGFRVDDELVSLNGQPLVSIADVSWVLHRASATGALSATVRRGDTEKTLSLDLPAGWRSKSDISRRVATWTMRAMALGGLQLTDLGDAERNEQQLPATALALFVKHAGEYDKHAAAKKAGFQKGDILVEVDGASSRMSEGELIGRLLDKYQPGEKVPATVLRNGRRLELKLPMQ